MMDQVQWKDDGRASGHPLAVDLVVNDGLPLEHPGRRMQTQGFLEAGGRPPEPIYACGRRHAAAEDLLDFVLEAPPRLGFTRE